MEYTWKVTKECSMVKAWLIHNDFSQSQRAWLGQTTNYFEVKRRHHQRKKNNEPRDVNIQD